MISSSDSVRPEAGTDARTIYLRTALPVFALYVVFVWRTPGWMFHADGITFAFARIGIMAMWLALIYVSRLKRDAPWREKHFLIGFFISFPWISSWGAYLLIASLGKHPHWSDPPLEGYLAWIASGIFYGILSGLWTAQTRTPGYAAVSSFLFFLLQFAIDAIFLSGFHHQY